MQVHKVRTAAKRPTAAVRSTQSQSGSKDVNSSLIQRALDLVNKGELKAGAAIKLFGIPKSTFYKKLSMCSQQPDNQSQQYYQAAGDLQTDFGTDGMASYSDNVMDSFGTTHDAGVPVDQWNNYEGYY